MTRTDRLSLILELLSERGSVTVEDMVTELGISPATARRDLDTLAEQRLIKRTHGGARSHSESFDLPLRYKYGQHSDAKRDIARFASTLVPEDSIIGLTGGTTLTSLAEDLASRGEFDESAVGFSLTVVTNAINIASLLVLRPRIKVVVPGGVVHSRSFELTGPFAEQTLALMSLDIAFVGVNAVHHQLGAMVHDDEEARVNRLMVERSKRSYIVADSSKIGRRAFVRIGDLSSFDGLITDDNLTSAQQTELEDAGLTVMVAGRSGTGATGA